MEENQNVVETTKTNEVETSKQDRSMEIDKGQSGGGNLAELKEQIRKLESQKREAFKERDDSKSKLKEKEDAEKIASGEFKTLAEQRQVEIDRLSKEKSELEVKANKYQEVIDKKRKVIKKELGEDWKEYMANLDLVDLEELANKLKGNNSSGYDKTKTGGSGSGNKTIEEKVATMYKT